LKTNLFYNKRIFIFFSLIIFLATVFISSISIYIFSRNTENLLVTNAQTHIEQVLVHSLDIIDQSGVSFFCKKFIKGQDIRLTLVSKSGKVICDTLEKELDNHKSRPEIISSNNKTVVFKRRLSKSTNQEMVYGAINFRLNKFIYTIRGAIPTVSLDSSLSTISKDTIIKVAPILTLTLILCLFLLFKFSRSTGLILYQTFKRGENRAKKLRTEFVANASHELKTPITSIKGFSQLLQKTEKDNPNPDTQKYISKIVDNSEKLILLFEDLISLSKVQAKDHIDKSSYDIVEEVEIIKTELVSKYNEKEVHITTNAQEKSLYVNKKWFNIVLTNLIENAIKYSEKEVQIIITTLKEKGNTTISIKDNGYGISQKQIERIFERFYRVSDSKYQNIKGTGIGLSLVKHIIKKHKGSIHVDSKESIGSIFTIKIPNA
jgi:two-component system phosphate regulon sensor histidine kinase PhoR